jgi:CRP-like cAMP-binding protein
LLHLQDALDEQRATLALLARIPLFATLDTVQRQKLAKALEAQRLSPGSVVLQEGAESQGFFIVRAGELEVIADERRVSTLGPGEFFGETALLNRTPITATVRAHTEVDLLRLPPAEFYALLSSGLAATLDQVQSRRAKERMRLSQTVVAEGAA